MRALLCTLTVLATAGAVWHDNDDTVIYTYTLAHEATAASYDESMAVACLQGILNRDAPRVYVFSRRNHRPEYWKKLMSAKGRWLHEETFEPLANLDALVALARPKRCMRH